MPDQFNWLFEPLVYFFFLMSMVRSKDRVRFPFLFIFFMLFLVGICSALVNGNFGIGTALGMRNIFRHYLFFLAVVNAGFSEKDLRSINAFFFFCFMVQIPVVMVKVFIYEVGEMCTGTWGITAASVSAYLPLVAYGYLLGLFLYLKPRLLYLLMVPMFSLVGVLAGKRAIVFLTPIDFMLMFVLAYRDRVQIMKKVKHFTSVFIFLGIVMAIATLLFGVKFMKNLSPDDTGRIDFSHLGNYVIRYETEKGTNPAYTNGRISTTVRVFTVLLSQDIGRAAFGYGPGQFTKSRFQGAHGLYSTPAQRDMKIQYGLTALTLIAIEYGYLGAFIYVGFMALMVWRIYVNWRLASSPYWKAVAFGSMNFAAVYVFVATMYFESIIIDDCIPLVFFYVLAITHITCHSNSIDPRPVEDNLVSGGRSDQLLPERSI